MITLYFSGHYGRPRMTRDIGIVVEVTAADAARLASALGEEFGAEADCIREAIGRQSLFTDSTSTLARSATPRHAWSTWSICSW